MAHALAPPTPMSGASLRAHIIKMYTRFSHARTWVVSESDKAVPFLDSVNLVQTKVHFEFPIPPCLRNRDVSVKN